MSGGNEIMDQYTPPFEITNQILSYVSSISEKVGRVSAKAQLETKPHLTKDSENSPTSISGEMNRFLYAF